MSHAGTIPKPDTELVERINKLKEPDVLDVIKEIEEYRKEKKKETIPYMPQRNNIKTYLSQWTY